MKSFRLLTVFLLIMYGATLLTSFAGGIGEDGFVLTSEEERYLDELKSEPIVIDYSYDLVNAEFDGTPCRMIQPVLDILTDEFGLTVVLHQADWAQAFARIESGEADFYGPIAISDNRRQKYITVNPFYRSYSKIITRESEPVDSMIGLYNRSIGLLDGSVITRTMKAYLGPEGETYYYPTMDAMIEGLQSGEIDAFATVDNAEFELLQAGDIRFEFSIDNYYVEQGLISGNERMRPLAELLNRYLSENPGVSEQITALRNEALLRRTKAYYAEEIAALQADYDEVFIFAETTLFPLCYRENGAIKGMQTEMNTLFTRLTGIPVRYLSENEVPDGLVSAMDILNDGRCMAVVGVYYNIDAWANPSLEGSPLLWKDTIRTYSRSGEEDSGLAGKRLGTTPFATDYLGWNNTTGTTPKINGSCARLLTALKGDEIDAVFMSEMAFNYEYSVRKEYSLQEVEGLSAEAAMHMLYRAENAEFNQLYNQAINLYHIIHPKAQSEWRKQSDKYKSDYIRMRQSQQVWAAAALLLFAVMLAALIYLFIRNMKAHRSTKERLVDALDKVNYDELTGLYNRRYLEDNLGRSIKTISRSSGLITVMMLDVDFFKRYNDTYGHNSGDRCLRLVAEAIQESLSRADDFVARYGGEEFVVVLPYTDENGGRFMANRILNNVRDCKIVHESGTEAGHVTISIGVTTGRVRHDFSGEDYIKKADEALYKSKQTGRDRYTFIPCEAADEANMHI